MNDDVMIKAVFEALCSPTKDHVWAKAHYADPENERRGFRRDSNGTWIRYQDYGDRNSEYGWEIDHISPTALGGSDTLENLRPLHFKANIQKSDFHPDIYNLALALAGRQGRK